MLSVAYLAPYIDVKDVTTLPTKEVFKLVEMYNDEVVEYVKKNGIKTVLPGDLLEEAYVLCNDTLVYIGVFEGGYIPSEHLAKYRTVCDRMAMLHTHPIPLPIPTPEDLVSMVQIGYNIECVLSRVNSTRAKMVCIELAEDIDNVLNSMFVFAKKVYSLVDKYIIVEDELGIQFIPYPSNESLKKIEKELASSIGRKCRLSIASLDMNKKEYSVKILP